jgi:acetyl-CoA synthetase
MEFSFVYEPQAPWIQDSHFYRFWQKLAPDLRCEEFRKKCAANSEWFWREALKDMAFEWHQEPAEILEAGLPFPKWASGGTISVVQNCIDRHLKNDADKIALIFEADEPGQSTSWSFQRLAEESSWIAQQLLDRGAKPGDRAALLMPMSLEMVASFFGALRAGLSVVPIFSGYGEEAILSRLQAADVKFCFVQKLTTRKGKEIPVLKTLEKIKGHCPKLKVVFELDRSEFLRGHHAPILAPHIFEAEDECLLLYTSGTTGHPKACVHTAFGVLATTGKEHRYCFDVHFQDRFFWYTDIGWMMGPWELFGALSFGASVVLYEGVPDYPSSDRIWQILHDHKVTHFGISPTAIRVLKKSDSSYLSESDFPKLRILGSTGEPWDAESWLWFYKNVGRERCPIMNISGGTEIMGCLLAPDPLTPLKPTSLGQPALGVQAEAWSEDGKALEKGLGHLVCLNPLPSMTKGFLGSKEKYLSTYFEKFGDQVWYHGDWALVDDDGAWFLRGRSDDTIKISGKRVGPNEYESALMQNSFVAESAAVGLPHPIKGECVHAFVVLKNPRDETENSESLEALRTDLNALIVKKMGKSLAAEKIIFVKSLPKTRSGKILRSLIRKIVLHEKFDSDAVENQNSISAMEEALS